MGMFGRNKKNEIVAVISYDDDKTTWDDMSILETQTTTVLK